MKPSHSQHNDPANPQPKAVSQQSPRLKAADCTATNSAQKADSAGVPGLHSAAQRNAIPEANVRKTVAKAGEPQSQELRRVIEIYACPSCGRLRFPEGDEDEYGPPECDHGLWYGTGPDGGGESEMVLVKYAQMEESRRIRGGE